MNKPRKFNPPLGPPRPGPKQRALSALRGIDLAPLEKIREHLAVPLKDLMPNVLTHLRMDRRRGEAEIVRVWNNLIDPTIAAHAQPMSINKGTLFVTVDSSVWLDEIVRYRRKEILDRLQNSFGKDTIARISFRVG